VRTPEQIAQAFTMSRTERLFGTVHLRVPEDEFVALIAQVQREAVEACAKECDRYRMRILVACRESTAEYLAATCRALLPKGDG
jgi:hypothetical protein